MSSCAKWCLAVLAVACASAGAQDASPADVAKENAELRKRVAKVEKDLAEVKQSQGTAKSLLSKYGVTLYGYVKFDAAYDTARTDTGNFARWVESEAANEDDEQFNATANQSRFGLRMAGPGSGSMETSGRVEIDFYGGGAENRPTIMMRHAYVELSWPDRQLSVLAGQSADVIAPLNPTTLNYSVNWWTGNIGYRRPQLRVTQGLSLGDAKLMLQGAVARTIGDAWGFHPGDTGEDAGFPTLQGRVACTFPLGTAEPVTLGLYGHWGQEQHDSNAAGDNQDFHTWSVGVDVEVPVTEGLAIKGEFWTGDNLDAYLGGIGQGVNQTRLDEITSTGGWVAAAIGPVGPWLYHVGAACDDPDDRDLNAGDRSQNLSFFGNALYRINEAVTAGVELSHWETLYQSRGSANSVRAQGSIIFAF